MAEPRNRGVRVSVPSGTGGFEDISNGDMATQNTNAGLSENRNTKDVQVAITGRSAVVRFRNLEN